MMRKRIEFYDQPGFVARSVTMVSGAADSGYVGVVWRSAEFGPGTSPANLPCFTWQIRRVVLRDGLPVATELVTGGFASSEANAWATVEAVASTAA